MTPRRLSVMVVDDSVVVLEHLRHVLERDGHVVTTRTSALGTVSQVMTVRPEVLLLDVSMPALDGDRLATVLSELQRNLILILHSSRPPRELAELARASGANGFISKTADVRHFLGEFHRIVARETLSHQRAAAARPLVPSGQARKNGAS